jgi:antirestriction protein ArdC
VPWVQPWGTAAAKASLNMPKNAATHRHYSGINVLILWGAVIECGFGTQNWLTFRQALGLGGNVRKGEHGTTIVYADCFVPDEERKRAERDGTEPSAVRFLKRFTVFNTDQCEDLPQEVVSAPSPVPADYIGSWLEVLREDDRAIVRAASAASKATDYLLAFCRESNECAVGVGSSNHLLVSDRQETCA